MAAPHNDNIREKILAAATKLLEDNTFGDISLAKIASEAGISKGSVYYYYKTKDDILYDVADSNLANMYEELERWVSDKNKNTSLPRLIKYVIERGVIGSGRNLRLNLTADAANGNDIIREKLIGRYELFCREIGKLVFDRIPNKNKKYTKEQQENFWGMLMIILIDGLMIQSLLDNPSINENKFAKQLVDMFVSE
ncbi:TetR/AcrR family transcriptional regulator [Eubacteriales bacterium KG127]